MAKLWSHTLSRRGLHELKSPRSTRTISILIFRLPRTTLSGVTDAFLIAVISIMFSMLAAIFAFVLIERVGRRPQLLIGSYGMPVCLVIMSLLCFLGRGKSLE
ncbi:sugar transporter [Colletotrichum musicola]|uniref:Sugar transporter n=1 Tax=Colletotrichum musicola TaxID=2175873 RepID=A0A8H6MXD5_9PEZI|nr:sugar transporter [Colletotrichum musicola]